jgi:hypothetical protein
VLSLFPNAKHARGRVQVQSASLLRSGHGEGNALRLWLLPLLCGRLDLGKELHTGLACQARALVS